MMQASNYQDQVVTEYCKDFKQVQRLIQELKYAGTPIKYVDWVNNSVSWYERGIYGVTYG